MTGTKIAKTRLYGFGSNGSGQLGVGHLDDLSAPQICTFNVVQKSNLQQTTTTTVLNDTIKKIVAGGNHTLILTASGVVYAAGENADGRCCGPIKSDETNSSRFNPVDLGRGIFGGDGVVTDVAATWDTSLIVVDGQRVFVFGEGGTRLSEQSPTHVSAPVFDVDDCGLQVSGVSIVDISASMGHAVIILSNGTAYGWGNCRKGQLGTQPANPTSFAKMPVKISVPVKIAQIATGRDYTVLRDVHGILTILGNRKNFVHTEGFRQSSKDLLKSGWSAIFSLEDHRLRGIGRNDRGQLPPDDLPLLRNMAIGSEHTIAQTHDDRVVAWGWGEHGNCGTTLDARGNVAGRYNEITLELGDQESVVGLGAGCATSFIWTTETG